MKKVKLLNPSLLILNPSKGDKNMAGSTAIVPKKGGKKPPRKTNPSGKAWEAIFGGIAAGGGGLAIEFAFNFVPVKNRLARAVMKGAVGVGAAVILQRVKFLSLDKYAGWIGAGGVAVAFAELAKMVSDGKVKSFLMPVRVPRHQKQAAIEQGAVSAEKVMQAAVQGNQAAQTALNDFDEDEELDDVVFLPVQYRQGMADVVLMPN